MTPTLPGKRSPRPAVGDAILDINLIPEEFRRPVLSSLGRLLLLAVLVLGGMLPLLFYAGQSVDLRLAATTAQLRLLQQEESRLKELEPEAIELAREKDELASRLEQGQRDYQVLLSRKVKWAALLKALLGNASPGLTVTSVEFSGQKESLLEVEGSAALLTHIASYEQALVDSGLFDEVRSRFSLAENLYTFTFTMTPATEKK